MARPPKAKRSGVHVVCASPHLWRWFLSQLTYVAKFECEPDGSVPGGFTILNEDRWRSLLSAAEACETDLTVAS